MLSILCFKIIPNQFTSTSQTFTFTLLPGSSDLLHIQVLRMPSIQTVVSTCSLINLELLGPPCLKSSVKTILFSKQQLLLLWKTFISVSVPVYMCVVLDLCCLCRCTVSVCVCACVCELCVCVWTLCVRELCVCVCANCVLCELCVCVCVQLVKCLGLRVIEAKCLWSKRKVTPTEVHVGLSDSSVVYTHASNLWRSGSSRWVSGCHYLTPSQPQSHIWKGSK